MLGGKQAYVIVCLDSGVQHPREAILEKSKLFLISVMGAKARKDKKKNGQKEICRKLPSFELPCSENKGQE